MKITSFIIALILVSLVAVTFGKGVADLAGKYSVSYDNDTIEVFDEADTLNELAQDIEEKDEELETRTGLVDLVGYYIGRAVDTLKVAKQSVNVFDSMTDSATEKLKLGSEFKTAFYSIIIVLIIIGVIAAAYVKRDL